jgi:uncharacterized protein (TIGR02452 family)
MSLKNAARQTLSLIEAGEYTAPSGAVLSISSAQAAAVEGTRLYTPDQLPALRRRTGRGAPPRVQVTDETTQVAAQRLTLGEGVEDLVLLNFASARNPGGGFLNGARAQEEDLCRCSGLYPCLVTQMTYYQVNRAQSSLIYTDHMIYSPGVPFFQVRGRGAYLERPFTASVITAPAPNAGPILRSDPGAGPLIREAFERRWANVLAVARDRGHRTVLLGAWGCGAFGNDPAVASDALAVWLDNGHFSGDFDRLVLAIPGQGKRSRANLEVFRERLGGR